MKTIWRGRHNALSLSRLNVIRKGGGHIMDSKEKIEALCGVIEELLELIQDETAANCIREEYRAVMDRDSYESEDWE